MIMTFVHVLTKNSRFVAATVHLLTKNREALALHDKIERNDRQLTNRLVALIAFQAGNQIATTINDVHK